LLPEPRSYPRKETTMQAERASLADTEKFALPPDLLAEVSRRSVPRNDLRVEAFKPSLLGRFFEIFTAKPRR
jgi:hypothetical protein